MPRIIRVNNDEIIEYIRNLRPNIAETTVDSYFAVLRALFYKNKINAHRKMYPEYFSEPDVIEQIFKDLEHRPVSSTRTIYSVLVVITGGGTQSPYYKHMMDANDTVQSEAVKQERNDKQKHNWMDYGEIIDLWMEKSGKALELMDSQYNLTHNELKIVIEFMAFTLACGIFIEPRRGEWTGVKIRDFNREKDNYLDLKDNVFVFHNYKSNSTYGTQTVEIPPELRKVLLKYLKHNATNWLLPTPHGKKLAGSQFTMLLNSFTGKNISSNMLRHIYLTHKYGDTPALEDMLDTSEKMGHSTETMLTYIKR